MPVILIVLVVLATLLVVKGATNLSRNMAAEMRRIMNAETNNGVPMTLRMPWIVLVYGFGLTVGWGSVWIVSRLSGFWYSSYATSGAVAAILGSCLAIRLMFAFTDSANLGLRGLVSELHGELVKFVRGLTL